MDINEFAQQFPEKMKKITDFVQNEARVQIANEAINHYKGSFKNEGFTDESIKPWAEVERRKPESPWYGHSGQTGRFSTERTTAKILTGETLELQNAFKFELIEGGVKVINDKPYAAVHQYGKMAKIYGKKAFKMIARPFVGRSKVMVQNINTVLKERLIQIIKS